jgi:hypothetical protein
MPKDNINGNEYIKIVLPVDFLNLPKYLRWVWRSDAEEAYALDMDMTIVSLGSLLANESARLSMASMYT